MANSGTASAPRPAGNPALEKLWAEAENTKVTTQTLIVKAWPSDALADRLVQIGVAALGAGGAAYVIAGYPSLDTRAVPALVAWGSGVVLLSWGLSRLHVHERVRMEHFQDMFKVQDSQKAVPRALTRVRRYLGGFGRHKEP